MKTILLRTFAFIIISSLLPLSAIAATLSVSPGSTSVNAGDIVTVRLIANTQGTAINQGEGTIRFPTDMLDVVSTSKSGSIFSLWVEEPSYSNSAGTVRFGGGAPNPGYTGSGGTIITITFRAKRAGTATLTLSDTALRANDGLGTDVLSSASGGSITITQSVVTPTPPAPTTPTTPTKPDAPATTAAPAPTTPNSITQLISASHPQQDAWYQDRNPLISWQLPEGATAVQTIVDTSADTTPSVSYTPAIAEKRITDLADGIWHFNIRARTSSGWGPVATYQFQVDATPPTLKQASFMYDPGNRTVLLSDISGDDALSGVERYEIRIDGEEGTNIAVEDIVDGSYTYPYKKSGVHAIQLRVFDRAGNYADTSGSFTVPTTLLNQTLWMVGGITITFGWFIGFILFISLLSLAAAIMAWIKLYTLRKGSPSKIEKRDKLLHRSLRIYKEDLEHHLRLLERAGTKRDLTDEEADLNEKLKKNVDDLERYLSKEFKKFD